jgi:hypothetical protein
LIASQFILMGTKFIRDIVCIVREQKSSQKEVIEMHKYKVIVTFESIEVEVMAKNKEEAKDKAIWSKECGYPAPYFESIPNCDVRQVQ